ncbi:hypothetical protein Agub_g243 [Astrephomene gubernaculifera]|uniref:Uncharacterized protein n=1 Tax=Astrephomene gubernaculifera TaxID=47775 RepID=A0AAD3DEE4_9CHLO|nr:hypothetical protein Agub_g243 [Astrephomene gubernaculifera]
MASYYYDEEAGLLGSSKEHYSFEFAQRQVRQGFVRKVLGLLGLQLLFTAGVTALFLFNHSVKSYVFTQQWPLWTSFGLSMAIIIALGCSENLRRSHPHNLLALAAFTVCEAVLVASAAATYNAGVVLLAVGMTAVVVLGCAVFATQSRVDLTLSSGALLSGCLALLAGLTLNLILRAPGLQLALCVGCVFLFSMYLVFDLQLLMGGFKYELSADEYVFAALNLYLDIINIFLYLLQLLGSQRGD